MKKIGIFYGSSSGTTECVARRIAEKLGVDGKDVHDVASAAAEDAAAYEALLLGTSTWGSGDLQDDWDGFLPQLKSADLSGKLVGVFGCGDSASFGDTFCDGMGIIYNELQGCGCKFIGEVDSSDYSFDSSVACPGNAFVGLALDEMNEENKTDERIDKWVASLKQEGLE